MLAKPSLWHFLSIAAMVILTAFLWKVLAYGVVAKRSPETAATMVALF